MSLVHEALYGGGDTSDIDFAIYLGSLAAATAAGYGMGERVTVEVAPSDCRVDVNTAIPLGLAASEAISNAFKHAFPDGRRGSVWLACQAPTDTKDGEITVSDDGIGVSGPFPDGRRGAGLSIAQALAGQIAGRITVEAGEGTVWRLIFKRQSRGNGETIVGSDRIGVQVSEPA